MISLPNKTSLVSWDSLEKLTKGTMYQAVCTPLPAKELPVDLPREATAESSLNVVLAGLQLKAIPWQVV